MHRCTISNQGIPFHFPEKCFLAYQTVLRNLTEMSPPSPTLLPTFTALFLSLLAFASATNGTIVVRGSSTTLLSENGTFQMGFFNANGESKWYLGIWYSSIPSRTYVWVANRENPTRKLETSTFEVDRSGRLAVKESENLTVWQSSNVEFSTGVKLLDNGNLVLLTPEGLVSWQSFDHPTDTWLPGMNLTRDQFLTSWQSSSNPSPGLYSLRLKTSNYGEFELVYNATKVYWITGNWTGEAFANVPEMTVPYIYNFSFVDPFTPKASFGFTLRSLDNGSGPPLTGFKIDCMGRLQQYSWWQRSESWNSFWARPESVCRVYGLCGSLGLCGSMGSRPCECLPVPGFKPVDDGAWESGDYSGGCRRENESSCNGNDEFERLGAVRFDGAVTRSFSGNRKACERACLNDCACVGLYYDGRSSLCKNIYGSLLNLQNMSDGIGGAEEQVLYVKRTKEKRKRLNLEGLIVGIVGSILVLGCVGVVGFVFIIKRGKKRKGMDEDGGFPAMNLKVFSYKELHSATRGFSEKLGHGGFGTVFQGVLPDSSTLVAVKRLERPGGGEREFRAEVRTIGNIQHLNLVRLRGFCSENSHRLLVYDYMPNGPLSAYLRREGPNLSWDVRFRVALNTARGIAYLHEECRDCIIHCDIKPENILLDSEYTAKVSDFGLAKLIGRDFSRVLATMRGTWGYVAPEWISGIEITTKADVYSYGMTLLELIGGRRNVEAPQSADGEGRAGGVVGKWFFPPWASQQIIEGNLGAVVDSRLGDAYDIEEAKRSALVAVWCIQDNETVRPSMGMVVKMLEGVVEVTIPPVPKLLQALVSGESFSGAKASSGNGVSAVGGFYGENMAVVSVGASESSLGDASSATNENVPKFKAKPPAMAVVSSSPTLLPLRMNLGSFSPNIPLFSISSRPSNRPRPPIIVFSYKAGDGLASEEKKLLLERYGLDPDEFLSEPPPPKTGKRKELQKRGRGKSVQPPEEPKPPRATHKLLQVLGGKARRKKLLSPKGMDVRPMMEVVKGAAFDILQAASGCPAALRPGRWLDLYSGTGSVGIEAISRGCSQVHFVEMDPWVVSDVLRPNLEWTGFLDVSIIHTVRVENFLERAEQFVGKDGSFDYISVTPPYTEVDYGVLMGQISKSPLIGEDTFIVVEYPSRTDMLDTCGFLVKITDRRFGRTHLVIYGPTWAQKKRKP